MGRAATSFNQTYRIKFRQLCAPLYWKLLHTMHDPRCYSTNSPPYSNNSRPIMNENHSNDCLYYSTTKGNVNEFLPNFAKQRLFYFVAKKVVTPPRAFFAPKTIDLSTFLAHCPMFTAGQIFSRHASHREARLFTVQRGPIHIGIFVCIKAMFCSFYTFFANFVDCPFYAGQMPLHGWFPELNCFRKRVFVYLSTLPCTCQRAHFPCSFRRKGAEAARSHPPPLPAQ